jgi:hypothetical protein
MDESGWEPHGSELRNGLRRSADSGKRVAVSEREVMAGGSEGYGYLEENISIPDVREPGYWTRLSRFVMFIYHFILAITPDLTKLQPISISTCHWSNRSLWCRDLYLDLVLKMLKEFQKTGDLDVLLNISD